MCLCVIALAFLSIAGCAGKKEQVSPKEGRAQARRAAREAAPKATLRVTGSQFRVEDAAGRTVLVARIPRADALLQPEDPSQGPLTLNQADCTLYKDGKPSLWLKAPVAKWQGGILTAAQGGSSGTVDGKLALQGKSVTWTARAGRLEVTAARSEMREPGQPALRAEGPTATWQDGLLTLPSGVQARAADGSASMRADRIRWRAATNSLEATGKVRMTRGRVAGAGERLTGDTALRRFRLTGGRPRITVYAQAPPLVAALQGSGVRDQGSALVSMGDQDQTMTGSDKLASIKAAASRRTPNRAAMVRGAVGVAVALLPAAAAEAARPFYKSAEIQIEADDIQYDGSQYVAVGKVELKELKGSRSELRADRIVATQAGQKRGAGGSRPSIEVARASGNVRITSEPKQGERMEATGAQGTYWPGTQKATLTGGVRITMTSPQLQAPAVMTGARADVDLAKRAAEVTRTPAAPVALRLQPKEAKAPVQLQSDRLRMDGAANRITATGSPVMTSDQGTVRAERIWFELDPQGKDVRMVNAEGAVRIDAQDPQQGRFQATAREAVVDRGANTVVLTGEVRGTRTLPGETEPERIETDEFTYNFKTGAFRARSLAEPRSRVTFRPKKAGGEK